MKVTDIVQKLLDKGYINAEEALVLLKSESACKCMCNSVISYPSPNRPYAEPDSFPPSKPQIWYTTQSHTSESTENLSKNLPINE